MVTWTEGQRSDYERRMAKAGNKSLPQSPVPERSVRHEPVGKEKRKEKDSGRFRVSVVSVRKRLIDPDNLTPKYFIDCLRYSETIPADTAEAIELLITQRKPVKGEQPHTLITVEKI